MPEPSAVSAEPSSHCISSEPSGVHGAGARCGKSGRIANVAGSTLIATDNHLMLGWETTAMHTVGSWLAG